MRQFVSSIEPDKRGILTVSGKDYRYFRQVLRSKKGDMIDVRLPSGKLQNMTLASIDDDSKIIELQVCADTAPAQNIEGNGINYYLFQFMPRPQKFELIVKSATECGVLKIIPVFGKYSEKSSVQAVSTKRERFEKIVKEARQQSGSPVNTEILDPLTVEEAVEYWKNVAGEKEKTAFVLSERTENCADFPGRITSSEVKNIAVAVGSEGGISPEEVEILEKGLFGRLHFAVNILRCETAALYGIAAVQVAKSTAKSE